MLLGSSEALVLCVKADEKKTQGLSRCAQESARSDSGTCGAETRVLVSDEFRGCEAPPATTGATSRAGGRVPGLFSQPSGLRSLEEGVPKKEDVEWWNRGATLGCHVAEEHACTSEDQCVL